MSLVQLPSAAQRRAQDNLRSYVTRAQNELRPYGDVDWDAITWDVTAYEKRRASQTRKTFRLVFTRMDETRTRLLNRKIPFKQPFADFVRAVVVHRQEKQPKSHANQMVMVRAARYLHEELKVQKYDPTRLTPDHLTRAIDAAKSREDISSAYRVGVALEEIVSTINGYGLARSIIDFKNPIPRQSDDSRIDERATKRREDKLPSEAALRALAEIANAVADPAGVIIMRAIELLLAGGFRINELLSIPTKCLVQQPAKDHVGRPLLDADKRPIKDVGIRYWPEKGGPVDVKWIATPMSGIVRRAVSDLRHLTTDARRLARWLWEHPGRAWLPPDLRAYGRNDLIPAAELKQLVGRQTRQWLICNGVPFQLVKRGAGRPTIHCRRRDLEAALFRMQPIGPMMLTPVRQELHESLFVCFLHQLHRRKHTNRAVVTAITEQNISDALDRRGDVKTIFERFGKTEEDGSPILITSHMFRHWLNTLAQEGGMSQHEIARWMGRRRIDDNAAYDHLSGIKMAENARELFRQGNVVGGIKELYDRLPIAEREDFLVSQVRTAHTTAYGMCMNDWSLMPCAKHGKCLDCGELLVEKGNASQEAETQCMLAEARELLGLAQSEAAEGTYGANNYVEHHRRMADGAARALAIHADGSIKDGTLVHLNPNAPSLFEILEHGVEASNDRVIADAPHSGGDHDFDIFEPAD
jgi:hypothetical protein